MKFCVLASGSKGNCTYIETKENRVLIDIGIASIHIERKLQEIGVDPKTIDSIFITHAHTDHTSGLAVFNKKYKPNIYITEKMAKEANIKTGNLIYIDDNININDLNIIPIKTSHDVDDSNGYIFENCESSLVYITDTGYVNEKYHPILQNRNAYIFESNHDIERLMNNPKYPHHLKIRILSDKGHLSNKDCAYYLCNFIGDNTKVVVLAHLSEENNTPALALAALEEGLEKNDIDFSHIEIASQKESSEFFEI
jgi:Metal-dependent hydrolases of the beta-lactamase superfamily I